MQKLPKISLFFCLTGLIVLFSGSVFASEIQKVYATVNSELTSVSDGEAALFSTPFPVLLLSEIQTESGSEIEPNESDRSHDSTADELRFDSKEYLKKSRLVLISLTIRDLIYPFHTHL